jgi:hypothetical protein
MLAEDFAPGGPTELLADFADRAFARKVEVERENATLREMLSVAFAQLASTSALLDRARATIRSQSAALRRLEGHVKPSVLPAA